jgi:hypothetical protein
MATDREFSVILKATDLSTQPINQIVEALRKLTEAQKANNEAAAKGAITAKISRTIWKPPSRQRAG